MKAKTLNIIRFIVIAGAVIAAGYYLYRQYQKGKSETPMLPGNSTDPKNQLVAEATTQVIKEITPTPENPVNPENIFVPYTLETSINRLNLNEFENVQMPAPLKACAGFGWPTFSTESTSPKLKSLMIGFTHIGNPDVYMPPTIPNESQHQFVDGTTRIKGYAQQLYNANGGAGGPYADAINLIGNNNNPWAVSDETAFEIGKLWSFTGIDHSGNYTRSFDNAWVLIDDEQMPFRGSFVGNVAKGMKTNYANNNFVCMWYGRLIHYFSVQYKNGASVWSYPNEPTDSEIVSFRTKESSPWNHQSVKDSKMTLDCGAYFKNMILHTKSKYRRSGDPDTGPLLLDNNGKRQFRLGDITETQFGRNQVLPAEPSFEQKYLQYRESDGAQLWNTVLQPGYYWNGWMGNPYTVTKWWSGVELSIRQQYEYVDRLLIGRLNIQDMNKGNFNINTFDPTADIKSGAVVRLETEYWTALGNRIESDNISENGIKLLIVYAFMCGIRHVETWGNGFGGIGLQRIGSAVQPTKPEGNPLYPTESGWYGQTASVAVGDDNHSRHKVAAACVNSVAKWMQGFTFDTTLKYVIFNTPIWSYKNFEIFATGVYQGTNLKLSMHYCMNDMVDRTEIILKAGSKTFNLTLVGDEWLNLSLTIPAGLNPQDFIIEYNTVYGLHIKKNGLCTGNKADQYLS